MPKLYTSEWHIAIEELSTMAESLKTGSLASLVCLVVFGNELFEVVVRSMRVAVFFSVAIFGAWSAAPRK